MAVPQAYRADLEAILRKRRDNGADYWATPDGRWGVGSPFSTFDCALMLAELGVKRSDPVAKGTAEQLFAAQLDDGRFRPAPKGAVYPCHTANAARALCRLGFARDRRLRPTFEHLLEVQHRDGGWRCNTLELGKGADTDASNPGVTLAALDALRFWPGAAGDARLDRAVRSLLAHWKTRRPLGPCHFGIGSRFLQVEYPFLRYNLFFWVYVLSHFEAARADRRFGEALEALRAKLAGGQMVVESPNRGLSGLSFCKKGQPSRLATKRWREIVKNVGGS